MNIAIIPARGGSKRIPRKNIKEFCGKPMIAWSIKAAQDSGCFEHIIVSTDDEEIAEIADFYGAEVPFMRPPELADDHTATRPVVNHAIREVEKLYGMPEYVCCLYSTAPFVRSTDLVASYEKVTNPGVEYVFSSCAFEYPIQRAFRIYASGFPEWFSPQYCHTRSQDLEPAYHDAAQFYWGTAHAFIENRESVSPNGRAYVLPSYLVQDIDTGDDWIRAELMFQTLNKLDRS
ncbi:N-acylneuraminate cytidylyltransferase [Desulfuromusa kysingii]|uniref:N-acylneuraminate cytidylyltransferase n=1 Tax=Desulfuromusa kysingii TaxID=37625 RepID=A0A1H3VNR6_9BACT|nr:pseudaminic acid cytidylyltransferase [Desulfuromusa kysingii]SDZ75894.1 N-acylneuraminate cytidylyltransferase [Desulfuromusa kysingii]